MKLSLSSLVLAVALTSPYAARSQSGSPHRGLWVGQAQLNAVNEVTIPIDEDNNAIAPDPVKPTVTADAAFLRILVHVNAAGEAFLLKDVAILNRAANGEDPNLLDARNLMPAGQSDLILVTDPGLYGELPPQPATRIASAAFDFGDSRATDAVDAMVDAVADAILPGILADTGDLNRDADRVILRDAQRILGQAAAETIIAQADVGTAFSEFLTVHLPSGVLDNIAAGTDNGSAALAAAEALRVSSFYNDTRAVDMVNAILAAQLVAGTNAPVVVHNVASSFADPTDQYSRFVGGSVFGMMMDSAAATLAQTAADTGTDQESVLRNALDSDDAVVEARVLALQTKFSFYNDTRSAAAVEQVLDAMVGALLGVLPVDPVDRVTTEASLLQTGRSTRHDDVPAYPRPVNTPTLDYDAFVSSSLFTESASTAANGAVDAAISEKRNNGLYTADSIRGAARVGATEALRAVYASAARAQRAELPLSGVFGSGDPRPERDIGVSDPPLQDLGLQGTLYLPANHPTNPFRHARHPDHTTGFNITRNIRLDFDSAPSGPGQSAFGVDRVTGLYREEIFGLHKPLGPEPETNPLGLKVEGTFELNRISLIDALNAL